MPFHIFFLDKRKQVSFTLFRHIFAEAPILTSQSHNPFKNHICITLQASKQEGFIKNSFSFFSTKTYV